MRRRTVLLAVLAALATLATAVPAQADNNVALPVVSPPSLTVVPRGFTTNAEQAIAIAKTSPKLQAFHRQVHPLQIQAWIWTANHLYWFIAFNHGGIVVAEVDVSPSGKILGVWVGPQARALYTHGNYAPLFDSPWVLVPFSLLFVLPFLAWRGLWRMSHLDGLAILAFLVSYEIFDHAVLVPAVWLAYPPLLYLLGRLLWIGWRGRRPSQLLMARLDHRVLLAGLVLITAARVTLSLTNFVVIDVGTASVEGAHRLVHGLPLYFNSPGHGDTYGPFAYLAYVPFELIFPWNGHYGYYPSAHLASVFFDLATIIGLVLLGRRLRPGRDGLRLGLILGWIWAACPFTLLGALMHTNDGLIAMLSVLGLLALASPLGRGALLGLSTAAKFSPAVLLPLFAVGQRPGRRGAVKTTIAFTAVVAVCILAWLPPGGFRQFWDSTIGFQINRPDVFSPWALHPGLHPLQLVLEVVAVGIALLPVLRRIPRDLAQVSALAGAATIAVQLPAVHWFYYYIDWFIPFLAIAVVAPVVGGLRPEEPAAGAEGAPGPAARTPVLAEA